MPAIAFAREPLTDALWNEAMPLLRAHWAEVAAFPDIPLEPDRATYAANEAAGVLRVYTARREVNVLRADLRERVADLDARPLIEREARLVGYACFFVRANPHYASSLQAAQDVIYIHPSQRGGTGYRFIRWCDEQLAAEGVQLVMQHVKLAHDFGPMLARQGYVAVDTIWAKRLDAPAPIEPRVWLTAGGVHG